VTKIEWGILFLQRRQVSNLTENKSIQFIGEGAKPTKMNENFWTKIKNYKSLFPNLERLDWSRKPLHLTVPLKGQ
jgi:hypothetical protein